MNRRRNGFTLIELLVVISIIALLISMLLPALTAARGSAASITCQSQLRSVGQASHMYAAEWQGYFPAANMYNTPPINVAPHIGGTDLFWPRTDLQRFLGVHGRSLKDKNPLVCPTYTGVTVHKAGGNYNLTYTYNGHYGNQQSDLTFASDGQYKAPEQLASGPSANAGGPSRKAFVVDGTKDGVNGAGLPQTSTFERYILMPYGSSAGAKGILNLHVGQSNNWAFFDGHVENRAGAETLTSNSFLPFWYLYW